jgi:hypothetical protein
MRPAHTALPGEEAARPKLRPGTAPDFVSLDRAHLKKNPRRSGGAKDLLVLASGKQQCACEEIRGRLHAHEVQLVAVPQHGRMELRRGAVDAGPRFCGWPNLPFDSRRLT